MPSGFPYFLQFKPEFCNMELMIWAIVSSRSCFCWLYRVSPSLAAKTINQSDFSIDHLVMSMYRVVSCGVRRGCLLWPVCCFDKTLLIFVLLHFVLQGQTCLSLQISLDFLLLHSNPLRWKRHHFFDASSRRSFRSSQNHLALVVRA